jgi:hypothetical protein
VTATTIRASPGREDATSGNEPRCAGHSYLPSDESGILTVGVAPRKGPQSSLVEGICTILPDSQDFYLFRYRRDLFKSRWSICHRFELLTVTVTEVVPIGLTGKGDLRESPTVFQSPSRSEGMPAGQHRLHSILHCSMRYCFRFPDVPVNMW